MADLPLTRMAMIFLFAMIFAFMFAMVVRATPQPLHRVHAGSTIPCFHPASPFCISAS